MAGESLSIRFIILSQDAGGIIGKEGATIRRFREESGANINITGSSGVERILNITGSAEDIAKAAKMVCEKLAETTGNMMAPPVTLRLLLPNSQCGPLVGKGGSKIKEIREASGATITIPSETLPGSSERSVTLAGTPDAISQCIYHICCVMLEVGDD